MPLAWKFLPQVEHAQGGRPPSLAEVVTQVGPSQGVGMILSPTVRGRVSALTASTNPCLLNVKSIVRRHRSSLCSIRLVLYTTVELGFNGWDCPA